MSSAASSPADRGEDAAAAFSPRPLRTQWPQDLPRYWYRDEEFATHFMNALSLLFPNGETFFIDSVRAYRERTADPRLEAEIRAFIGQEGWHRSVHRDYNDWLARQGLPAERCEQRQARRVAAIQQHLPPRAWLAATVCLEHVTAILAQDLLSRPERLRSMHPHFRRIWVWHAIEELEHKAVAYDLFECTGGRHSTRIKAMLFASADFAVQAGCNTVALLRADGLLWKPRIWWQAARFLFGRDPGLVWRVLPHWFAFFRRDFHPSQQDDRPLIRRVAAELGDPG